MLRAHACLLILCVHLTHYQVNLATREYLNRPNAGSRAPGTSCSAIGFGSIVDVSSCIVTLTQAKTQGGSPLVTVSATGSTAPAATVPLDVLEFAEKVTKGDLVRVLDENNELALEDNLTRSS